MDDAKIIYADYQATTPVDPRVLERMAPYWNESFGNPHSSDHAVGWRAAKAVQEAAESVAGLIGADPDEIIFTSGATEANNLALFGLARRAPPGRNRILVSAIEHKCVLAAVRALAGREGFDVEMIPVDREGLVDPAELEARLDDDVLAVSVMAVNNESMDLRELAHSAFAAICKDESIHSFTVEGSRADFARVLCRCHSAQEWALLRNSFAAQEPKMSGGESLASETGLSTSWLQVIGAFR